MTERFNRAQMESRTLNSYALLAEKAERLGGSGDDGEHAVAD